MLDELLILKKIKGGDIKAFEELFRRYYFPLCCYAAGITGQMEVAEGVQAGGKLSLVVRKLKVKAIPANLPGEIVLDVTNLGLGKSIKVKDLSFENFEIVNAKEVVVAQIKLTRAARAAAQEGK